MLHDEMGCNIYGHLYKQHQQSLQLVWISLYFDSRTSSMTFESTEEEYQALELACEDFRGQNSCLHWHSAEEARVVNVGRAAHPRRA